MIQNEHLEFGLVNFLKVDRYTSPGIYLLAADDEDVLLPNQYCTKSMQIGDIIEVFVYTDSEDRAVATTLRPTAMRDEFGYFEVVDTTSIGAFVDWGLPKDLFVPRALQKQPFKVGEKKLLRVVKDTQTDRLIGTQKIAKYLETKPKGLYSNSQVDILVYEKTELGFKAIVNNMYHGLLFHSEIFTPLAVGESKKAYVKNVRSDGNIDIVLQKIGDERKKDATQKVLELVKANGGSMPFNYKSDAQNITETFGVSKKVFKHALTVLQEKNLLEIKETGIYLK